MKGILLGVASLILLAALLLVASGRLDHDAADVRAGRKRSFAVGVAEDVSVRRYGVFGIDFIRCGKCRIEKRKLGALTFGAFNELVLEDLSVVVPPVGFFAESDGARISSGAKTSPSAEDLTAGLGIGKDFLLSQGCNLRFSGLRITDFALSTLDAATNVVMRMWARRAEAKRDGLRLSDCLLVEDGRTNRVAQAVLRINPLRVIVENREIVF